MSLVSSGLSLIHVTTVERDESEPAGWGDASVPDWQPHLTSLRCRYWATFGREQMDAESQVVIEDMRLIVPLGTDVTEKDRLGDITYQGTTIVTGPVGIRAVLAHKDHLELILVRLG